VPGHPSSFLGSLNAVHSRRPRGSRSHYRPMLCAGGHVTPLFRPHEKTDICLTTSFSKTTWISWHQKGRTNLDFNEGRNDGVTVPSAGPHANHLHLAPDRQHESTSALSFFYSTDAFPDALPSSPVDIIRAMMTVTQPTVQSIEWNSNY